MSDFTDWGEQQICQLITGQTIPWPASLSIGLLETVDDANFTEVSWPGYARVDAPRSLTTWSGTQGAGSVTTSNGTSRNITNNVDFDFGTAGTTTSATAIGVFSNSDLLCYAIRDSALAINEGDPVIVPAGDVIFSLPGTGGFTNYAVNKLADLIFRGQAFSFPSQYRVALYVKVPDLMGAGGVEASGAGYARAALSQWSAPDAGIIRNSQVVQFGAPTATWGTISGAGLLDGSGNIFFVQSYATPKTIAAGAGAPRFPVDAVAIQVQ